MNVVWKDHVTTDGYSEICMRSYAAIAASIAFGAVHLWFRAFPNWRFALLAAVAGVFYGLAFRRARSIRASMVTHALVVTTWRVFF
jgi:membrane protease YdiL (CAAX protease family)